MNITKVLVIVLAVLLTVTGAAGHGFERQPFNDFCWDFMSCANGADSGN